MASVSGTYPRTAFVRQDSHNPVDHKLNSNFEQVEAPVEHVGTPQIVRLTPVQHGWNLMAISCLMSLIVTSACAWKQTWLFPIWIHPARASAITSLYTFALTLIGTLTSIITVNAIRHNLAKHIAHGLQSSKGLKVEEFNDFYLVYNGNKLKLLTGKGLSRWWAIGFILATLVTSATTTLLSPHSQDVISKPVEGHSYYGTVLHSCISDSTSQACNFNDTTLGSTTDILNIIDSFWSDRQSGFSIAGIQQLEPNVVMTTNSYSLTDYCYGTPHCNSTASYSSNSAMYSLLDQNNRGWNITNSTILRIGNATRSSSVGTLSTVDGSSVYQTADKTCSFTFTNTSSYIHSFACQTGTDNITFALLQGTNSDLFGFLTNGSSATAVEYTLGIEWLANAHVAIELTTSRDKNPYSATLYSDTIPTSLSSSISRELTQSTIKNFTDLFSVYASPAVSAIDKIIINYGYETSGDFLSGIGYDPATDDFAVYVLETFVTVQGSAVLNALIETQVVYSQFTYLNSQQVIGPSSRTFKGLLYVLIPLLVLVTVVATYASAYRGLVNQFDVSSPLNLMALDPDAAANLPPKVATQVFEASRIQLGLEGKSIKFRS